MSRWRRIDMTQAVIAHEGTLEQQGGYTFSNGVTKYHPKGYMGRQRKVVESSGDGSIAPYVPTTPIDPVTPPIPGPGPITDARPLLNCGPWNDSADGWDDAGAVWCDAGNPVSNTIPNGLPWNDAGGVWSDDNEMWIDA